jgi:hypothetical protein
MIGIICCCTHATHDFPPPNPINTPPHSLQASTWASASCPDATFITEPALSTGPNVLQTVFCVQYKHIITHTRWSSSTVINDGPLCLLLLGIAMEFPAGQHYKLFTLMSNFWAPFKQSTCSPCPPGDFCATISPNGHWLPDYSFWPSASRHGAWRRHDCCTAASNASGSLSILAYVRSASPQYHCRDRRLVPSAKWAWWTHQGPSAVWIISKHTKQCY